MPTNIPRALGATWSHFAIVVKRKLIGEISPHHPLSLPLVTAGILRMVMRPGGVGRAGGRWDRIELPPDAASAGSWRAQEGRRGCGGAVSALIRGESTR